MRHINRLHFSIYSAFIVCLLAGCSGSPATLPATSTSIPAGLAPTPAPTVSPAPTATPAAGDLRTDSQGIEQVWVPAGSFLMGTSEQEAQELLAIADLPAWVKKELPSEQPQHEVQLTSGYWLDRHEVTNAAFQAFIDTGGYRTPDYWSEAGAKWLSTHKNRSGCLFQKAADKANYPCVGVNWYEAEAYAKWRGGRLPTEAEWEYAARGPESLIYPWGNTFDKGKANVVGSKELSAVGNYPEGKSWVNALDMAGNAMEWVQDWLNTSYYKQNVQTDPPGPASGTIKIEKGGWWGSNPYVARSAYRHYEEPPDYADRHIGFRIVSPVP